MIALQLELRLFKYWALLNDLLPEQASSPGYRHPPPHAPDLLYGLGVRRGGSKLLDILGAGEDSVAVDRFVRASWKDEVLGLAQLHRGVIRPRVEVSTLGGCTPPQPTLLAAEDPHVPGPRAGYWRWHPRPGWPPGRREPRSPACHRRAPARSPRPERGSPPARPA